MIDTGNVVRISGWTNSREIRVEGDRILLEVARTDNNCHRCATCLSRADKIEEFLKGGSYVWQWVEADGGKWISVALPKGVDPMQFLADAIGLQINDARPTRPQPKRLSGSTTLSASHRRATARIDSWSRQRHIIVESDRVMLQITLSQCNHCRTCSSRVGQIGDTLHARREVLHRWEYIDGLGDCRWISLPRTRGQDPFDILREKLDISVTSVHWLD